MTVKESYVDLGLPSGVKWAKCNLGASKETDYGSYELVSDVQSDPSQYLANSILPSWGNWVELRNYCTWEWQTDFNGSGHNGVKIIGSNENYIFIPAGGFIADGNNGTIGQRCVILLDGSYFTYCGSNNPKAAYAGVSTDAYIPLRGVIY